MTAFAETTVPLIDARVEFWSGAGSPWPRDWHLHTFAARIVHRTGGLLYRQEWLGTEPETFLVHPLPAKHDLSTRRDELEWAIFLLRLYHRSYADRYREALLMLEPAPIPSSDEWQFAVGLARQISNETWSAYDRYRNVVDLLVSLLERGVLRAGLRSFHLGEPFALPPGTWYNEVYHAWFATCQVDLERPFSGVPVRADGHWIMFDTQPFEQWESSVRRSTAFRGAETPAAAASTSTASGTEAATDVDSSSKSDASASPDENCAGPVAPPTGASSSDAAPSPDTPCPERDTGETVPGTDTKAPAGVECRDVSAVPHVDSEVALSRGSARKRKVGARAHYDWPAFASEVLARIKAGKTYRSVHNLADEMAGWCQDVWGKEPSSSRLRSRITEILDQNGVSVEQA
jgi:hypothetical protein